MTCTTLDNMWAGLYDRKEQGFFRYAVSRDWQVPHYEKMLITNANLGSVYLAAYQVTGRKQYKDIALVFQGTCRSVSTTHSGGYFTPARMLRRPIIVYPGKTVTMPIRPVSTAPVTPG